MIEIILYALQCFAIGAWGAIKGIAIGLWNEPLVLTFVIIIIACSFIKRKLFRRH